jgi:hypothetical protein
VNDRITKLLEVYDLDEIIELLDLEPYDVLSILDEQGLLDKLETPEPL